MSIGSPRIRNQLSPVNRQGPVLFLGQFQAWNPNTKLWVNSGGPISKSHGAYPSTQEGKVIIDTIRPGPPFKDGGPLDLIRANLCEPPLGKAYGVGLHMRQDNLMRYVGGFNPPQETQWGTGMGMSSLDTYMHQESESFPSFEDMGDEAYNRSKPRLEKAGGGVFLAELRDLPRQLKTTSADFHSLWKGVHGDISTKTMRPKRAADTFLNHHFGWAPFISDIGKFYNAFDRADQHIAKLTRENGQWIRRGVSLVDESWGGHLASGNGVKLFPTAVFDTPFNPKWFNPGVIPTWSLSEIVTRRVWAVGRYRYYRPEFDAADPGHLSRINDLRRQISLYGLRISPSNIYKATPWTWAIDWVSNFGDQVDRANDALVDSIAAKYLFVMQRIETKRRFVQTIPFVSGHITLTFDRIIETKQRRGALSPYGFSLSLANLTPRQLAIAGALGVSRGFR